MTRQTNISIFSVKLSMIQQNCIWRRVTEFIKFSVHFAFAVKFSFDGNPTINALAHLEFETKLYRKCRDVFFSSLSSKSNDELMGRFELWVMLNSWVISLFLLSKGWIGIFRYFCFTCSLANQTMKFERFQVPVSIETNWFQYYHYYGFHYKEDEKMDWNEHNAMPWAIDSPSRYMQIRQNCLYCNLIDLRALFYKNRVHRNLQQNL